MESYQNIIAGLFLLCTLLSSTCKDEQELTGSKKAGLNTKFDLAVSENAIFTNEGLLIELTEISDSRCPVNVQCIWAGNAKVKLFVRGTGTDKANLDLCLGQCDNGFKKTDTLSFNQDNKSYSVILTKVIPYPGADEGKKTAVLLLKKN